MRSSRVPRRAISRCTSSWRAVPPQKNGANGSVSSPIGRAGSQLSPTRSSASTRGRQGLSSRPDAIVYVLDLQLAHTAGLDVARHDQPAVLIKGIVVFAPALLGFRRRDEYGAPPAGGALGCLIVAVGHRRLRAGNVVIRSRRTVRHPGADADFATVLGNGEQAGRGQHSCEHTAAARGCVIWRRRRARWEGIGLF